MRESREIQAKGGRGQQILNNLGRADTTGPQYYLPPKGFEGGVCPGVRKDLRQRLRSQEDPESSCQGPEISGSGTEAREIPKAYVMPGEGN